MDCPAAPGSFRIRHRDAPPGSPRSGFPVGDYEDFELRISSRLDIVEAVSDEKGTIFLHIHPAQRQVNSLRTGLGMGNVIAAHTGFEKTGQSQPVQGFGQYLAAHIAHHSDTNTPCLKGAQEVFDPGLSRHRVSASWS